MVLVLGAAVGLGAVCLGAGCPDLLDLEVLCAPDAPDLEEVFCLEDEDALGLAGALCLADSPEVKADGFFFLALDIWSEKFFRSRCERYPRFFVVSKE